VHVVNRQPSDTRAKCNRALTLQLLCELTVYFKCRARWLPVVVLREPNGRRMPDLELSSMPGVPGAMTVLRPLRVGRLLSRSSNHDG
jgi:hypothetical protein